jgi:hypothetical protein
LITLLCKSSSKSREGKKLSISSLSPTSSTLLVRRNSGMCGCRLSVASCRSLSSIRAYCKCSQPRGKNYNKLCFLGTHCLKITLSLNSMTSSRAKCSDVFKIFLFLLLVLLKISNSYLIFQSLS